MDEEARESTQRWRKAITIALTVVAIAMAVYQLAFTQYLIQGPTGHRITHLSFSLVVVLLALLLGSKRGWYVKLGLLLSALVITGYLMIFLDEILMYRSAMPAASDLIIAIILLVVIFAVTYLIYGKTFPIVAAFFLAYLYFGRYLPYPFTVADVSVERLLMWLISVGTEEGIYGDILAISANYLFLFIFFGSMLDVFGGTRFIMATGQWIGSKLRAGPAMTAVVGSSMLGTITGSTVANITITGAFTIPMMKKAGYTPEQAGAIEAVSSSGGQIMPPIMGATAFVMAGFAGIPYIQIAIAAIVPALLYYFCVFCYVYLTARKMKVQSTAELVTGKQLLLDAPIFFIPLAVLVFLLAEGFTLPYVAFWSMMTLVTIGLLSSLRREARLNLKRVVEGLTKGVITASQMAIVCALIGVTATCIKVSGLGIKLPLIIQEVSHGYLIIALAIAMVSSIVLGMGVPTPVAYMLVAIGAVPALIAMGVPLLPAHLFCFIFAVASHLTPPVAIGTLVASQIAGAKYWPTAWEAVKAAFSKFLLPFFIVYVPVIILRPQADVMLSIVQIIGILLIAISTEMGFVNYCLTELRQGERVAFMIVALLCLISVFTQSYLFFFAGVALFIVTIGGQFTRTRVQHINV